MFPTNDRFNYKLLFLNIFLIIYFLFIEISIGFEESSKAIIARQLINGNLHVDFFILGYFFQLLFDLLNLILFLDINYVVHLIFFFSPLLWIILFNIIYKENENILTYAVFLLLFFNPFFLEFIHFAWRQSLALSCFLIFWSMNLNFFQRLFGSSISTIIHFGITPTVSLMILFQLFKNKSLFLLVIVFLIISSFVIAQIFPFPKYLIPDFLPYSERLTLSFDTYSFTNVTINNIDGNFILRYFLIGIIPILIISLKLIWSKIYFNMKKIDYNLILAGSFPLVLFATIPTANRLAYFFIFISMIYGPHIFEQTLKIFLKEKLSILITFIFLFIGHVIIYTYFMI